MILHLANLKNPMHSIYSVQKKKKKLNRNVYLQTMKG